jgi:hypothetical protein
MVERTSLESRYAPTKTIWVLYASCNRSILQAARGGCLMKMLPVNFTNDGQQEKEATEFDKQKRIDRGHRQTVSAGRSG